MTADLLIVHDLEIAIRRLAHDKLGLFHIDNGIGAHADQNRYEILVLHLREHRGLRFFSHLDILAQGILFKLQKEIVEIPDGDENTTTDENYVDAYISESAENKKIDFKSIFKRKKEDTNEIPAEENKEADNISEEINSTDNPSGPDTEEKEDYPVYSGYSSGDVSSEAVDSESETGEVYEEEKSENEETEAEETKDAMDDQVNDGEDSSEEGEQTDKESGSYNTII